MIITRLRHVPRWFFNTLILLLVVVILALLLARAAMAQPPVMVDCQSLAEVVGNIADFRDTGAKLELVIKLVRSRTATDTPAQRAVLVRELRRMWKEKLPAEDAGQAVYKRCMAQMGDMGRES